MISHDLHVCHMSIMHATQRVHFSCTVLEFWEWGASGLRVSVWVESCTTVSLEGHFLFTCSDTFAVGCIS